MRLSLLLGEVTGRAMVLNGEGRELVVESLASAALEPDRLFAYRHDRTQQSSSCYV